MAKYPAQIDDSTTLPTAVDNTTPIKGALFNRSRDAILAIESELGVKPSASYSTVRARLDVIENIVGNLQLINLSGDLGGTIVNPKVVGMQGRPVSNAAPHTGDLLVWSGAAWTPDTDEILKSYVDNILLDGEDGYYLQSVLGTPVWTQTEATLLINSNLDLTTLNATTNVAILVDTNFTVSIKLPAPRLGKKILIKDKIGLASIHNITVIRHLAENIERVNLDYIINNNSQTLHLISDGTDWFII